MGCSPGELFEVLRWHRAPVACERSNRMLENSVSKTEVSVVDTGSLSEHEQTLLTKFRRISEQRQQDILRLLEVFTQFPE